MAGFGLPFTELTQPWFIGLAFVVGLIVGSFLNVVGLRLLSEESFVAPPSHCPSCKTPIRPQDNIPVLSFLLLRGQCRACQAPISIQYPLIELLTAVLFAALVWQFGVTLQTLFLLLLAANLMVILITDWRESLIFNFNSIYFIPVGIIYSALNLGGLPETETYFYLGSTPLVLPTPLASSLLALLVPIVFFEGGNLLSKILIGAEGFGRGDTFMMMAVGAFLGWQLTIVAIFVGFILQAVPAIPMLMWRWIQVKDYVALASSIGMVGATLGAIVLTPQMTGNPLLQLGTYLAMMVIALVSMLFFLKRMKQTGSLTPMPLGPSLVFSTLIFIFTGPAVLEWYFQWMSAMSVS